MSDYYIAFDTRGFVGANGHNMRALKVTIEHVIIDESDPLKMNVGLCADPLYPELARYIKKNAFMPPDPTPKDTSKFKVLDGAGE